MGKRNPSSQQRRRKSQSDDEEEEDDDENNDNVKSSEELSPPKKVRLTIRQTKLVFHFSITTFLHDIFALIQPIQPMCCAHFETCFVRILY